jgi:hypothetical protein
MAGAASDEEIVMKGLIIIAATAAALAASVVSAQACDPRLYQGKHAAAPKLPASILAKNHPNSPGDTSIVGFWRVTYSDPNNNPVFSSLQQWHSDGTEFEFADIPTITGDICMGTWVQDRRTAKLWHTAWTFDGNGNPAGTMVLTETPKVSRDGNSFGGPFDLKFYDLEGNLETEIQGTNQADRLTLQ